MGRTIRELIERLPQDRKAKVQAQARLMADEMIEASSLEALRKAAGQTQAAVAKTLGIGQNAVSQLESRTDLYVSTLSKYVKALGLELELALLTKSGERVSLASFHPWELGGAAGTARSPAPRRKARPAPAAKTPTKTAAKKTVSHASLPAVTPRTKRTKPRLGATAAK